MKKIVFFILICLAVSCVNVYSECTTSVSGIIDGQTWTLEGSPYCVEGDVVIEDLVIEPSVIVEFAGDFAFDVPGTLIAEGVADDMIQFKKSESIDGWQGISFLSSSENSRLVYCIISGYRNGGLKIYNSTPVINHTNLVGNTNELDETIESGSGLYVTLSSSPTDILVVENSTISNNLKYGNGAGLYSELSVGSMVLRNCDINNNNSTYSGTGNLRGGGIYALANGGMELENCNISGNSVSSYCNTNYCGSSAYGGGIYVADGAIIFKNCHIKSNIANGKASTSPYDTRGYGYGGGVYASTGSIQFLNTIISSNSLSASGDATYIRGGGVFNSVATIDLTNCSVISNIAYGVYNSGGISSVSNSILFSNLTGQIYGTANVTYSDIEGGYTGEGNIDGNPLFRDLCSYQVYGDYSPCTDTGSEYPWYNDSCFLPSYGGERNDMGAYGGPGACGWCAYPTSCPMDPCGVPSAGDFDEDGDVDSVDLFIFSGNYGTE